MSARVENESEILLGNKQLLVVFAVVAILLATAFTGGYMLGKSSAEKKAASGAESSQTTAAETNGGPITQRIAPEDSPAAKTDQAPSPVDPPKPTPAPQKTEAKPLAVPDDSETVLGSRNQPGAPRHGDVFVQVMAVGRKEADATVDVLRQHEFQARVAPAPGTPGTFRVLVGPSKDAADLRNTEDKLRKIGFTKCFVQHY